MKRLIPTLVIFLTIATIILAGCFSESPLMSVVPTTVPDVGQGTMAPPVTEAPSVPTSPGTTTPAPTVPEASIPTVETNPTEPTELTEPTEATVPSEPTEPPMTEPTQPPATIPVVTEPPAHSHKYTSKVVAATCTTSGYTLYTCSCGDSYQGNKTGRGEHHYVDTVVAPTSTQQGYTKHTCSVCGDSYTDSYVAPSNHTHDYVSEYVLPPDSEAYYLYSCACGDSYKVDYSCGVQGHTCRNESVHELLMEYIAKGCTMCGSNECPCLLPWPDYTQCPKYNEHKDPRYYCQDCGLLKANRAESGQECCLRSLVDNVCPWCNGTIKAGKCHHCVKP